MAVTTIDARTALVIIDLQQGIVSRPTVHPMVDVIARSRALAEAFRLRNRPVVLVNVAGTAPGRTGQASRISELPAGWDVLIPELDRRPEDIIVTKHTWGAFTGTDLDAQLKKRGVTQVVLAGVATSAGVESTARQAHELGYNVSLATDAMTDMSAEAHANSLTRIFPRLGETGTAQEIIALLDTAEP